MTVSATSSNTALLTPLTEDADWEDVRAAGVTLAENMQAHITALEEELNSQRAQSAESEQAHESALFEERQRRETQTHELRDAREQIQHLTAQLDEKIRAVRDLEAQRSLDSQEQIILRGRCQANAAEIDSLQGQVEEGRVQIRLLTEQLSAAVNRANALDSRVDQLSGQVLAMQQQIIANQTQLLARTEGLLVRWVKFWKIAKDIFFPSEEKVRALSKAIREAQASQGLKAE